MSNHGSPFWHSFLQHANERPQERCLIVGEDEFTYESLLQSIELDSTSLTSRDAEALSDNSLQSIVTWLRVEKNRPNLRSKRAVDYVSTSGSTGSPKSFFISVSSQLVSAQTINEVILKGSRLNELIVLPLSHSSARGRLRAAFLRGAQVLVAPHPIRLKSVHSAVPKLGEFGVALTPSTHKYLVSRMRENLWDVWPGLKSVEFGSAPLAQREIEKLREFAPSDMDLVMHYGLTEASRSFLADLRVQNAGEIGHPLPHVTYRLGHDGELFISGPHTGAAIGDPQFGENRLEEIPTGDLFEENGSGLKLIGRKKNVINTGGFTIFAEKLEESLLNQTSTDFLVIVGLEDEFLGERPVIFVPRGKADAVREAWSSAVVSGLRHMRVSVIELDLLPTIGPGKTDRATLRGIAGTVQNEKP